MTEAIGSFGKIRVFEDFLGSYVNEDPVATFNNLAGSLGTIAVATATATNVVDEPGGVISIATGATDNDNAAVYAGVFKPADGGCVIEARVKLASATTGAIFVGFMETLAVTTPVMAIEYATTTQTTNSCAVGMLFDPDATTDIWRAVAGDATTAATGSPTSATTSLVADQWDVVRVEITADKGDGYCYLNGNLIKKFPAFCTVTDVFHAVVMVEDRSSASITLEMDYFYAEGARDWTV